MRPQDKVCPQCKSTLAITESGPAAAFRCRECGWQRLVGRAYQPPGPRPSIDRFSAEVVWSEDGPTMEQIAALRRIAPEFSDRPLRELVGELKASPTRDLGKLIKQKAEAMQRKAAEVGIWIRLTRIPEVSDPLNAYNPQTICEAMGLGIPAVGLVTQDTDFAARLIFAPSFDPECAITIVGGKSGGTLTFTGLDSSYWQWFSAPERFGYAPFDPENPVEREPEPFSEELTLSGELKSALAADLRVRDADDYCNPERVAVADGMTAYCLAFDRESLAYFETHSPRKGSPAHAFLATAYRAAYQVVRTPEARQTLENLHSYLDLGLGVEVTECDPVYLRFYGGLSSREIPEIDELLVGIDPRVGVLMDLRSQRGIAGVVHDVFDEFAKRPGKTAFVAAKGIDEGSIDGNVGIFIDKSQAVRWLKGER